MKTRSTVTRLVRYALLSIEAAVCFGLVCANGQDPLAAPSTEAVAGPRHLASPSVGGATDPHGGESELLVPLAPANDVCEGAEVIPGNGPFPYLTQAIDISSATSGGDPVPSCQSNSSGGIWFSFTPTLTAAYTISTCENLAPGTTRSDTVLAIFNSSGGACPQGSQLLCSDDDTTCSGHTLQSTATATLNAGVTYFVLAYGFGGVPAGSIQLSVIRAPSNDACGSAINLLLDSPVAGSTVAALNDYRLVGSGCFTGVGQTSSGAGGRDVAYSFTAPTAGSYSFRVTKYGSGNAVLYVASTCPTGTRPITVTSCLSAANRSTGSAEEVLCLPMAAGATVYTYVDETATSVGGSFTVEVNRCPREAEPNDTPGSPNNLGCGVEGSTSPAGDADFYALGNPMAGSRLFALADGVAANPVGGDFTLRVTTDTDTVETDDDDADAPFGSTSPALAGTPLPGLYSYIRVDHASTSTQSEPYRLYWSVQPPIDQAIAEVEPNDTLAQAGSSPVNYFRGDLGGPAPSTDQDLYAFSADLGDILYLALDGDPLRDNTPINGKLELLDATGAVLVSVNDGNAASSTTPSPGTLTGSTPRSPSESLVYRSLYAGTYYARVAIGTASAGATGAGNYLLSIVRNCAPFAGADLAVSVVDGPDPVGPGQDVAYTFTVLNNGPGTALNVQLASSTPASTVFRSIAPQPGWNCSTPPVGGTGTVSCSAGGMGPGGFAVFTLVVRTNPCVPNGTAIACTGTVSSPTNDLVLSNNAATETTTTTGELTACDDGNSCTTNDTCSGGSCVGGAPPSCEDGNGCTDDSCHPVNGCIHVNHTRPCDDGTACTTGDACSGGVCSGAPVNCNDGNACTQDSCNPATGCVHANLTGPCDDGNVCTSGEACAGGACQGGSFNNNDCEDGSPCSRNDVCSNGVCQPGQNNNGVPCDDGSVCTVNDLCQAGSCAGTPMDVPCDDGNACTIDDGCVDGECLSGALRTCNDGNVCTIDSCNPATGCVNTDNSASCADINPCTTDSCNPASGCVHTNNTLACNDGNPCTSGDVCNLGFCEPGPPNTNLCNDGNACTTNDRCSGGICLGGPPPSCDDASECTNDYCNPFTGCVHQDISANCIDGNVCTDDVCNPAFGCANTNNTAPCDDGNPCTAGDVCSSGACVGGPPNPCDDGNLCTDDSCDTGAGCVHTNNTAPCDDGSTCTSGESCSGGTCQGGTQNTAPCDDNSVCTVDDHCSNGACVGGPAFDCNDQNLCTDDTCHPTTGCIHTNNAVPCSDGTVCTTGDTCSGGSCSGTPVNCSDGSACTADSCDAVLGCRHVDNCPSGGVCNVPTGLCEQNVVTTSFQQGASYSGTHDTQISEPSPNTTAGSSASWEWDSQAPGNGQLVGLLRFAGIFGSGTGQIPSGARILSANLALVVFDASATPAGEIRESRVTWDEGTATWNNFGGEAGVQADEQGPILGNAPIALGTFTFGVTSSVQAWSNAPSSNFGWIFLPHSSNNLAVRSSESSVAAEHPKLTVQYTTTLFCTTNGDCADGNLCNGAETCINNVCNPATPLVCADGNICTNDSCSPAVGCVFTPNAAPCNDGNACTTSDTCASGACAGGPAPNCDDANVCTDDFCNPASGCAHASNAAACNDGSLCTTTDTCSGGSCIGGPPPNCDDGLVCTDDACNPATGCVHSNNTAPCSDGNACTSNDTCSGGGCVGGPPTNCNDANVCTDDSCAPATGCVHTNNTHSCDDGSVCTTTDVCGGGTCHGGAPASCGDGNPCTTDTCDASTGCVFTNNSAPCNDGNVCTTGDTCGGGVCAGGPPLNCSDGNPCTNDSCAPATGCAHANNTLSCEDQDACTVDDTCSNGVCLGGPPRNCDDGNGCTDDACNPASGCTHANTTNPCDDGSVCTTEDACQLGACIGVPIGCDDGNVCTDDSCHPVTGCQHANNTSPCSDGSACTTGDACSGGVCVGGPPPNCDDGNLCTSDSCSPGPGCQHVDNTAPCNDGSLCTTNDACSGGVCAGGPPLDCDDGNPCTDDCNPAVGCEHTNNTSPCSDGNACTTNDACSGGACLGGPAPNCNDGNLCTDDSCVPASGCLNANNTLPCDDGSACTANDACAAGACAGVTVSCDDGDPCTADTCAPASGCHHVSSDTDTDGVCDLQDNCPSVFNPGQANGDSDSRGDDCDCAPLDGTRYAVPSAARNLTVSGHGPTSLVWSPPTAPGGDQVLYDVLRSINPANFNLSEPTAICIATAQTATSTNDAGPSPPTGRAWCYLVRSGNGCGGNLGSSSSGTPRTGRTCP